MLQGHRQFMYSVRSYGVRPCLRLCMQECSARAEFPGWAAPSSLLMQGPSVDGAKVYDEKCAILSHGRVARAPHYKC